MKRQWPRGTTAAAAAAAEAASTALPTPLSLYSTLCLTLLLRNGCRKLKNLPVFAAVVAVFRAVFSNCGVFCIFFSACQTEPERTAPHLPAPLAWTLPCLVSAAKHLACLSFTPLPHSLFIYLFPFALMIYAALLLIDLKLAT